MSLTDFQIAARIANPWNPLPIGDVSERSLSAAAEVLQRQSASLMGLRSIHGNAVLDTPLASYIETDRDRYRRERQEYERLRLLFEKNDVRSMLFKSAGSFPSFHYLSSNLDVIVPDGRIAAAREVLQTSGYVELLNVEEPAKFLFRRFPADGTTFAFHLHEVVGWGVPFLDSEPLWESARNPDDDPDILIPAPRHALAITTAHWFYEDKEISLGNLFLTAQAVRDVGDSLDDVAMLASERGWEEGYWAALEIFDRSWKELLDAPFLSEIQRAQLDAGLSRSRFIRGTLLPRVSYSKKRPATIPFLTNKVVYYRKVLADRRRSLGRRVWDVVATILWAVRWKLHIRSQRPVVVSISGCDGSGKSVQVERLVNMLDRCDIRSRVLWARGGSSRFAGAMFAIARALRSGATASGTVDGSEEEKFERRQASLKNPLIRFVFAQVYALDLVWPYVIKTRFASLTGNVVVCDRYIYDAFVDFALYTGGSVEDTPLSLKLIKTLSPRPRVRIYLDVEPTEALRRKPEEGGLKHLAAARDGFRNISDSNELDVVSANLTMDQVTERVGRNVLAAFYWRYGTFLNGLLWSNPRQLNPGRRTGSA